MCTAYNTEITKFPRQTVHLKHRMWRAICVKAFDASHIITIKASLPYRHEHNLNSHQSQTKNTKTAQLFYNHGIPKWKQASQTERVILKVAEGKKDSMLHWEWETKNIIWEFTGDAVWLAEDTMRLGPFVQNLSWGGEGTVLHMGPYVLSVIYLYIYF